MTEPDALIRACADVFEVPADTITDDSSQDSVPRWDSLGMVRLLAELESRFGVEFDLMEIANLRTVGGIRGYLADKGVAIGKA